MHHPTVKFLPSSTKNEIILRLLPSCSQKKRDFAEHFVNLIELVHSKEVSNEIQTASVQVAGCRTLGANSLIFCGFYRLIVAFADDFFFN